MPPGTTYLKVRNAPAAASVHHFVPLDVLRMQRIRFRESGLDECKVSRSQLQAIPHGIPNMDRFCLYPNCYKNFDRRLAYPEVRSNLANRLANPALSFNRAIRLAYCRAAVEQWRCWNLNCKLPKRNQLRTNARCNHLVALSATKRNDPIHPAAE
jgi:hypothetical protein